MGVSPSRAAEPSPAVVDQVAALWRSGRVTPLRPLASPWLVDADVARQVEPTLRVLHRAVEQLLRWWGDAAPFLSRNCLDPRLHAAALLDLRMGRLLGFTRFDVVCPAADPSAVQLLEVQAGDPSGMAWHDALGAVMHRPLPAGAAPLWMMPSHLEVFASKRPAPRAIAFVVLRDSIVESDHRLLCDWYCSHGWHARVVDPSALHVKEGRLSADGHVVGAVFRDALDELFSATEGAPALLQAHASGAVVVLNSFIAAAADDKSLLEALTTPAHWDAATARTLLAHVPWTRRLGERKVEIDGHEVDLVPHARRRREHFVLKPVDGYGGFGVVVGPHVTQLAWERAIEDALRGGRDFVLQRFVPLPVERIFAFGDDGRVVASEQHVVHSFWMHEGRFAGAFVRSSVNPVVNVHQGGGLAPVFFCPPLV